MQYNPAIPQESRTMSQNVFIQPSLLYHTIPYHRTTMPYHSNLVPCHRISLFSPPCYTIQYRTIEQPCHTIAFSYHVIEFLYLVLLPIPQNNHAIPQESRTMSQDVFIQPSSLYHRTTMPYHSNLVPCHRMSLFSPPCYTIQYRTIEQPCHTIGISYHVIGCLYLALLPIPQNNHAVPQKI